jgi:DNA-nicking Smr family endonuclease
MKHGRVRGLRPDEQQLWEKIRQSATPLHTQKRQAIKAAVEHLNAPPDPPKLPQFRVGEKFQTLAQTNYSPGLSAHLTSTPVQMDRKRFDRMKKGKLAPEARVDLHGMTITQAHSTLVSFVLRAHGDGLRLILVITGKGKTRADTDPIPSRIGAIKHQVPSWLRAAPLKPAVLQVSEAHVKHGGSGAFYVYLRRQR